MNEADTCRRLVRPLIEAAGWDTSPHCYNEQIGLTDGRIIVAGNKVKRCPQERVNSSFATMPNERWRFSSRLVQPAMHLAYNAPRRTRRERA